MPPTLEYRIAEYLSRVPSFASQDGRHALLYMAVGRDKILALLDYSGPSILFARQLVARLGEYGALQDGRDALAAVLDITREEVGIEQAELCRRLVEEWMAARPAALPHSKNEQTTVLSGAQIKRMVDALLGAFSAGELARMVRYELDVELEHVAEGENLVERADRLVRWAVRQNRVSDLIAGAYAQNPSNQEIARLFQEMEQAAAVPSPASSPKASPPPVVEEAAAAQIFLAYSRRDADRMQRVYADLSAAGFTVWIDSGLAPGTPNWQRVVEATLRRAQCLVVMLSPHAKGSEWVGREITLAQWLKLPIYPLLVDGDQTNAIPFSLVNAQYVDARDDYAGAMAGGLLPVLARQLGGGAGVAPPAASENKLQPVGSPAEEEKTEPVTSQMQPEAEELSARNVDQKQPKAVIAFDLVSIPAGKFTLSKEAGGKTVDPAEFNIARQPVTCAQFAMFAEATGLVDMPIDRKDKQVTHIRYADLQGFCGWVTRELDCEVRLPDEAEWEKAMSHLGITESDIWEQTATKSGKHTYVVKKMQNGVAARFDLDPIWGDDDVGFRVVILPNSRQV